MAVWKRWPRSALALLGVGLLAWLVVLYRPSGRPYQPGPDRSAVLLLLVPLAAVVIGVLRGARWGAMLGIAVSIAVLPWALVLSLTPTYGAPIAKQVIALFGATVLLLALIGLQHETTDRDPLVGSPGSATKARWVDWCLILNIASLLNLYLFLIAYSFGASWEFAAFGVVLLGLTVGAGLLLRDVTGGLLVLGLSAALLVPAAVLFVAAEARSAGEAWLFAVLFVPGIVAAIGAVSVLRTPLVRLFRESA